MVTKLTVNAAILEGVYGKVTEFQANCPTSQVSIQTTHGESFPLLLPPSCGNRVQECDIGTWYQFDNILEINDSSTGAMSLSCPNCGTPLITRSREANAALRFLNEQQVAGKKYVGLDNMKIKSVSSDIVSTQKKYRDQLRWHCPQCYVSAPQKEDEKVVVDSSAQSLYQRVHAAACASSQQSNRVTATNSIQQSQLLLRSALSLDSSAVVGAEMINTTLNSTQEPIPVAIEENPITGEQEVYADLSRHISALISTDAAPDLDLVILIDTSGSMGNSFSDNKELEASRNMLTVVSNTLTHLRQHLGPTDRFGVACVGQKCNWVQPLNQFTSEEWQAAQAVVKNEQPAGTADFAGGYREAVRQLQKTGGKPAHNRERRILILSDSHPVQFRSGSIVNRWNRAYQNHGIGTSYLSLARPSSGVMQLIPEVDSANCAFAQTPNELRVILQQGAPSLLYPICHNLRVEVPFVEPPETTQGVAHDNATVIKQRSAFPTTLTGSVQSLSHMLIRCPHSDKRFYTTTLSWTDRIGSEYTERLKIHVPSTPRQTTQSEVLRRKIALLRYRKIISELYEASDMHVDDMPVESLISIDNTDCGVSNQKVRSRLTDLREYLTKKSLQHSSQQLSSLVTVIDSALEFDHTNI